MKKIMSLIAILLFASSFCFAQKIIKAKDVNLNDPESIQKNLPLNAVYTFEQFTDGKVYFKDGTITSAKMNYNTLIEEMQFMNDKNEIMSVANPSETLLVKIGDKLFHQYKERQFAEVLLNADIMLCVKRKTQCVDIDHKVGAYGQSSATSSISQVNSAQMRDAHYKLAIRRDLTLKILDEFFVKKGNKMLKITSKNTIIKAFPEYKKEINEYFAKKDVDLKSEQDLLKLITYFNQLKINNKES